MLNLCYTIPLTSATCERSFSSMGRLKTWLRVNTVANLLNDIMFANIQKAQMDDLSIKAVAQEFANTNEERIKLLWQLHRVKKQEEQFCGP